MFLQAALVTLGVLLVLALGVGVASVGRGRRWLLLIGVATLLVARRALAQRKLLHTTARLTLDAKQVMETVK